METRLCERVLITLDVDEIDEDLLVAGRKKFPIPKADHQPLFKKTQEE